MPSNGTPTASTAAADNNSSMNYQSSFLKEVAQAKKGEAGATCKEPGPGVEGGNIGEQKIFLWIF